MVPDTSDLAGPTHFPDSIVAQDLPASTDRPGLLRRDGDEHPRQGHGDSGHAEAQITVTEFLEPSVILDVIEKVVGEIASAHERHGMAPLQMGSRGIIEPQVPGGATKFAKLLALHLAAYEIVKVT
jgi:hypothetical protein